MKLQKDFLLKFHQPAPRYTSYPTAPEWKELPPSCYVTQLMQLSQNDYPISLYLHIPFCKSMCLYCGCSVILNRKYENEVHYVETLLKEILLVTSYLNKKKRVAQIHFGGGTPTKLSTTLIGRLMDALNSAFSIEQNAEISIEIDPRTVFADQGEKLHFLRKIGFNRVSFGVQDTNPQVQEAVKRRQSLTMTETTYQLARSLGFVGINIDLIYGLPYQTVQSFEQTVSHILQMRPDRIAFFSYAQIPWLKPHQKAIPEATLPTTEEKWQIYANARNQFVENKYVAIGMDHFSLDTDEFAIAYRTKKLQRNFQGYSLKLSEDLLGFGVTAIGFVGNCYFQNIKELKSYSQSVDKGILPIYRGKMLTRDDLIRKWVIHTLMCDFELDKTKFQSLFMEDFDLYFNTCHTRMIALEAEGLLVNHPLKILITPLGELFIRIVVMIFDAYLNQPTHAPKFSHSI